MALYAVRENVARVYLGPPAETSFGSPNASWRTHYLNPLEDFEHPTPGLVLGSDLAMHTGKTAMSKQFAIRRGGPFTLPLPWSPQAFALAMGYGLGHDVVGSAPLYLNSFSMLAGGALLPGFTLEPHAFGSTYDSDSDWALYGNTVDAVVLSGGPRDWGRIELQCRTSGAYAAGTTATESGLTGPSVLVPGGKVRLWWGPATTEGQTPWGGAWSAPGAVGAWANSLSVDLTQHLSSWQITIPTNAQGHEVAGVAAGVGVVGGQPNVHDPREIRVDLTLDAFRVGSSPADVSIAWDKALFNATQSDNYEGCLLLEWTSDLAVSGSTPYSGGLVLPLVALESVPGKGTGRGKASRKVTFVTKSISAGTDYGLAQAFAYMGAATVWGS